MKRSTGLFLFLAVTLCQVGLANDDAFAPQTFTLSPGPDVQYQLQERLIQSVPGDVIELTAGRYELRRQLDVVCDNITIRGAGSEKTILSFKKQDTGGQGLQSKGNNLVLEGFAVEDTAGNAIKILGARNVTFRDIRTEWTGKASSMNGAYGIYPVQCENVLIENCTAIGASDAGLYVGQCKNVVVRNSHAERNVAGIEIENTIGADVYGNTAINNTGGILVFDLPGLPVKSGGNVRVFQNRVESNNHPNFAAPGNMVATVPPGTGVMVMVTDDVEIFDNDITGNNTTSVSIVSFLIAQKKFDPQEFDPIPTSISIHDNRISKGGSKPGGVIATVLAPVFGKRFPDILFDGVVNPQELVDGKPNLSIRDNGSASYANFNLPDLTPEKLKAGQYQVITTVPDATIAKLDPIVIRDHDPATATENVAVKVYRSIPTVLSEWNLFEGDLANQQPAKDVVPYELNTELFSDYTTKYRFIRIPDGTQIDYNADKVFEFPVGTVIAKTFAYPNDMTDGSSGEYLLETRIEERRPEGWFGYSYAWNEGQTDAELVLGGSEMEVSWIHSDGKPRTNRYQIPNANQCISCHEQAKKFEPIGPNARNLNRDFGFASGKENQLVYLQRTKRLQGMPKLDEVAKAAVFDDPHSGSLDRRARTWLDVNCAHCHNPAGSARTSGLDLSVAQDNPTKYGVWKTPVAAGHGSGGHDYDIVPGQPDASILMFRIESEDPSIMMPNLARRIVPTEGTALIREWIAEMEAPKE